MATRQRQATAPPVQRRGGNEPPPYQAPSFPLNPAAQRALANLRQTHSLKKLEEAQAEARSALSNSAAEINDRLYDKEKNAAKRKQNAEQTEIEGVEQGDDGEVDQMLAEYRDKVDRMTQRMDESMRKLIDGQHSLEFIKTSIASTAEDARANASTQASTQNVRSQRSRIRQDGNEDDEEEDADEEYQDFQPTDPAASAGNKPSPVETFRSKMENEKTRYQSHSLTARYAMNNEYRDFRRVVHDAKHPDGDVVLPHHSEWFNEGQAPAPGVTTRRQANSEEDGDDDDDIAVSRANVSTKCPLTLQEFTTPLTSTKCPHSFESNAILSMIGASNNRENGRPNGERFVQCPVSGCSQTLTKRDLHTDNVLIRQIKRIQRARELDAEDAEDMDEDNDRPSTQRRPTVIDDEDEDGADVDDIVEGRVVPQTQVKNEPKGTAASARSQSTVPIRYTAVVDLDDDDSDEADEDAMEE